MFLKKKKQAKLIYSGMKRVIQFVILTIILPIASQAQQISPLYKDSIQMKWVDEKYNSMSLEEKVGQ